MGDGTTDYSPVPKAVNGGLSFSQLDGGYRHTCGITTGNQAYCWGHNTAGEIGNGTSSGGYVTEPQLVVGGLQLTQVTAGYAPTCAIVPVYPRGYCWGLNNGVIGTGFPVAIPQ